MAVGPITRSVQQALTSAPRALRHDLSGYTNAVVSVLDEIARDRGVQLTVELADQFLSVVLIRRLWLIVEGQYWLMHDSLDLLSTSGEATGYRIGRTKMSVSSDTYSDARLLLESLRDWLEEHDLWELVGSSDLGGILTELAEDHGARH